jgi:hypothetical protein
MYLMALTNYYLSKGGKISDVDIFVKTFYNAISDLKQNKKITFTSRSGEVYDFATAYRLGSDADYIEFIIKTISDEIKNKGITYTDDKRTFDRSEIESKLYEQDGKCIYCHKSIELDESIGDHMIPHSKGGRTIYQNLAVSCKDCNSIKSSLPWDGWVHAVKAMNGVDLSNLELDIEELVVNQNA